MKNQTVRCVLSKETVPETPKRDLPKRTQKLLKGVPQPKPATLPEGIEDNTNGVQRLPKLPRAARKPKEPKICACGCAGATKGGRFIPGHDARLHGWALRVTRGLVKLEDIKHEGERAAVKAHLGL